MVHRYLAQEPSELLAYCLWLVLPPNSLKRPREDTGEGFKEHDPASHLKEAVDIKAEV